MIDFNPDLNAPPILSETIQLAINLIERPSVTPLDEGCQALIAQRLANKGFKIQNLPFGEKEAKVQNLWATHSAPNSDSTHEVFCFVGHTDVVPAGNLEQWSTPPFKPVIKEGYLYGRGSADMKGSVASMVVALENFVTKHPNHKGTVAILLTSDEEGPSIYGIKAVVEHFKAIKQPITWAVVGEPSSEKTLGDIIKNGRRGSLSAHLTIHGKQGHIAYPHLAINPIIVALPALKALTEYKWDEGFESFPPTQFQISNIHSGTGANNVIPANMDIDFNFRFSPKSEPKALQQTVEQILNKHQLNYTLKWSLSGMPFFTSENAPLIKATIESLKEAGYTPSLSTGGGTSDGRFIFNLGSEIIELGPVNATIHQVNECVKVEDLNTLTSLYENIMKKMCSNPS